tara:strand:- start:85 stop:765 length:681 start_codon:yes stop_codon:yes gene_type:complete
MSIGALQDTYPDWHCGRIRNKYSVEQARNRAVSEAREHGVDWLIMVDDDITVPSWLGALTEVDAPIVGGIVPTWRDGLIFFNAFQMEEDKKSLYSVMPLGEGVEEVYAVGTAILAINREILDFVASDPLFEFDMDAQGVPRHIFCGEDMYFCRKMQEQGFPIMVEHSVQGEHTTAIPLLETIKAGNDNAHTDPNHCFPSMFRFDISHLSSDFPADAYFSRRMAGVS